MPWEEIRPDGEFLDVNSGAWMLRQNPLFAELFAEERAAKARVLGAKANLLRRSVGRNSPGRRISGRELEVQLLLLGDDLVDALTEALDA
ncbi:MAG: hypothetical protein O7G84_04735 [Gammaproteobacteria bacterium]|nr:hypothetical protein [Gammaproteobacteria bacterium]